MKKRFKFLVLAFAALTMPRMMVSCSDDDDNDIETEVSVSQLPAAAKSFLDSYYPDSQVKKVEKEQDNGVVVYDVSLQNGHDVTFNSKGEWIEVDAPDGQSIPSAIIPVSIASYLDQNYSGYGVNDITKTGVGYEVELVSGLDMVFDSNGNFLGID